MADHRTFTDTDAHFEAKLARAAKFNSLQKLRAHELWEAVEAAGGEVTPLEQYPNDSAWNQSKWDSFTAEDFAGQQTNSK